ncbi:MAG: helix-turn-helix transcriptional regulator [Ruminococcus sp.]|nr:helix-turn-helix transcriptional regulator [Ruminococcus sp.]
MRHYLFELRKKANKTQAEVSEYLSERLGLSIRYSAVERGYVWKDLSHGRAAALAEILETTEENILTLEETKGGYEGKNAYAPDVTNFIRGGRKNEYDTPLTAEEKLLAEKYYPYADKVIGLIRCNEYSCFLNTVMTYEDYYDIGILAFLRSIKKLSIKKTESTFIDGPEDPDRFYKFCFSRAIKDGYYKYIRSELTLSRKKYHSAVSLDGTIANKDGDETEYHNFVPDKELPITVQVESSWSLDVLYSYLNESQITACKMLIADRTAPEIIKQGIATKKDIGIIRFYLEQIKKYGKILWKSEDFKSGTANVHYDFVIQKWVVAVMYETKRYSLGGYSDINTALDLHTALHYHLQKKDFIQWYEAHMQPNIYKTTAFTYPLPCDLEEKIGISCEPPKFRGGTKVTHSTKDGHHGVRFVKSRNIYEACIGSYRLGQYKSFDEALKTRQIAEEHYYNGDFEMWYKNFRTKRAEQQIPYARMAKHIKGDKVTYTVTRTYKRKCVRLGTYSYDEALQVKAMADSHIDEGDFDQWAKDFYAEYLKKSKDLRAEKRVTYARINKLVKDGNVSYEVMRSYKKNITRLGRYAYEEALQVKTLADSHIDEGDFDRWAEDFYAEYQKKVKEQRSDRMKARMSKIARFTALYVLCKYAVGKYILLCYDELGRERQIFETNDSETAYKTMDIANSHIESGDFDVWAADNKILNGGILC